MILSPTLLSSPIAETSKWNLSILASLAADGGQGHALVNETNLKSAGEASRKNERTSVRKRVAWASASAGARCLEAQEPSWDHDCGSHWLKTRNISQSVGLDFLSQSCGASPRLPSSRVLDV